MRRWHAAPGVRRWGARPGRTSGTADRAPAEMRRRRDGLRPVAATVMYLVYTSGTPFM